MKQVRVKLPGVPAVSYTFNPRAARRVTITDQDGKVLLRIPMPKECESIQLHIIGSGKAQTVELDKKAGTKE